jgi:uncharacterized protein (TIGR00255 family)
MTGFGRAHAQAAELSVQVEIRSVNHRFLQVRSRVPRDLSPLEQAIESRIREWAQRGRVDVTVTQGELRGGVAAIGLQHAAAIAGELRDLMATLDIEGPLTLRDLLTVPGFFSGAEFDEEEAPRAALDALEEALGAFDRFRLREGAKLAAIIRERLAELAAGLAHVLELAPERMRLYQERLELRMQRLIGDAGVDPARVLQEVAAHAEKLDVAEECDRLKAHIGEMEGTLARGGAIGRRLDFLAQELQRECNTLGAKAASAAIAQEVVGMKEEVERIREQVANIE